jgi:RNA polymerase sigma-70 factor (ECF subfamily)
MSEMAGAARLSPSAVAPPGPAVVRAEFRALYDAHFAFVWRTLLHFGLDAASAEDAAQEVFVILHRRLDDYDGSAQLRSWLWGICRRVAQSQRRTRLREVRRASIAPPPGASLPPDAALDHKRAADFVQAFLDGLPEEQRDAFVLIEIEGMSAPEAAQALEVGVNTVYSRLRLAREHLARASQRLQARTARAG